MALITCPNCGKAISSSAFSCPNCGYWLKYAPSAQRPQTRQTESLILGLASLICCTIWALPFAIVAYEKSKTSERLWLEGNVYESQIAAQKAERNFKIGLWVAVVPLIISVIVIVIVALCTIIGTDFLANI